MKRVLIFTVLLFLPFLNKAYHIDDPVFLVIARQIRQAPLIPYDFLYHWTMTPLPAWVVSLHPPLNSYFLALIGLAAEEKEIPTHAAYLLLTLGCAALMLALARRFCRHPILATVLTLASPGFFVTATNVMADVPLLFFWLLSVWIVVAAAQDRRPQLLWAAAAAMACAALTKYFGLALVPLLGAYWWLKTRRLSLPMAGFFIPLLVVILWGWYSVSHCGLFHPLASAGFAAATQRDFISQIGATTAFLGGCLLWPVFALPLIARLPARWLSAVLAVMGAVLLISPPAAGWLWAVMVLGGVAVAALACAAVAASSDAETRLLGLWVAGVMIFALRFNWTVNARILLPAAFPAAVLVLRWIESLDNSRPMLIGLACSCLAALFISFKLALADQEIAGAGRDFARSTARREIIQGRNAYFTGHWGFQYYMEKEGALPFDFKNTKLAPGDKIFISTNNNWSMPLRPPRFPGVSTIARLPVAHKQWLTTVDAEGERAGFYTSLFGSVPFNIGRSLKADIFLIQEYRP